MPERIRPQSSHSRRVSVGRVALFICGPSYGIPTLLVNFCIRELAGSGDVDVREEARPLTGMARRPVGMHSEQHRVPVTVNANSSQVHGVATRLTLLPELLP